MNHSEEIRSIVKESWDLRRAGRLREAELKLYEALEKQPENPFLQANLADVYLRQGKPKEARDMSLQALEKNTRQVMALTVLGEAALKEKNTAEAVENLKQAHAISPNPYRAGRLARAHELAGNKDKALDVLQQVLEGNPGDSYLRRQYMRLKKEITSAHQAGPASSGSPAFGPLPLPKNDAGTTPGSGTAGPGKGKTAAGEEGEDTSSSYAEKLREQLSALQPPEAAAQLEKIVRVGKRMENPHLQSLLGDFFRQAKDDQKAALAYKKAREIDPGQLYPLSQEAFCYRRLGRKEEAWPLLKILLEKNPGDRPVRSSFIRDAEDMDRLQEAIDFLAELINRHPHHKEIYGFIKKLENKLKSRENE